MPSRLSISKGFDSSLAPRPKCAFTATGVWNDHRPGKIGKWRWNILTNIEIYFKDRAHVVVRFLLPRGADTEKHTSDRLQKSFFLWDEVINKEFFKHEQHLTSINQNEINDYKYAVKQFKQQASNKQICTSSSRIRISQVLEANC